MEQIKAIGFDLFNTLITARTGALEEAVGRLTRSLLQTGLNLDLDRFKQIYREAALGFIEEARQNGKETHNRFWISAALNTYGHEVQPEDPIIARAVNAYFSAFPEFCHLIPGTNEMLESLSGVYRLGLLSNFTHAPAALEIIKTVGLTPCFDVMLISGELGYRKPHPLVFNKLIEGLGVDSSSIIYVGDDPEPDVKGAQGVGIHPVWMTYVRETKMPMVPGSPVSLDEEVDSAVPRISNWEEFLVLLNFPSS